MKVFQNAAIMPLQGDMDAFTGGIMTEQGEFVSDCLPHRGSKPEFRQPQKFLKGTYIYGGCLFGHFGHFIWESLAHMIAFRKCRNYPIVFITPNENIFNMQKMFFKTIGVKNVIVIIKQPTKIENLVYMPPGCSIVPLFATDEHINSLIHFNFENFPTDPNYDRIWLSRSGLRQDRFRKVENEIEIEEKLLQLGYTVVHPETLSLPEQARLISTAEIVAGFDGSAFFSLLFSKGARGNFYIFNSRSQIPSTLPYVFDKKGAKYSLNTYAIENLDGDGHKRNWRTLGVDRIVDTLAKAASSI